MYMDIYLHIWLYILIYGHMCAYAIISMPICGHIYTGRRAARRMYASQSGVSRTS